jgi:fluoride exporter
MVMLKNSLVIMLGGALGSLARYGVMQLLALPFPLASPFPWATLLVNLLGSFLMGWLAGKTTLGQLSPTQQLFYMTGLMGGFTTFSSLALDWWLLIQADKASGTLLTGLSGLYLLCSILLGLAFVSIGWCVGRM